MLCTACGAAHECEYRYMFFSFLLCSPPRFVCCQKFCLFAEESPGAEAEAACRSLSFLMTFICFDITLLQCRGFPQKCQGDLGCSIIGILEKERKASQATGGTIEKFPRNAK